MANGEYEIDEQTFRAMQPDTQLWMLYRTFNAHRAACDQRLCAIERHKAWNARLGAISGVVGGAAAVLGAKITGMFGGN